MVPSTRTPSPRLPSPRKPLLGLLALVAGFALSVPAFAAKGSDTLDEDDNEKDEDDKKKNNDDDDKVDKPLDPDNDDDWAPAPDKEESELKFDDESEEDTQVAARGPGEDTAKLYREYLEKVKDLSPDEEALAWERYLKKYPKTNFKTKIQARLDELGSAIYDEQVEDTISRAPDAGKSEIRFAQPASLESIDPRSKVRAGFGFGRPSYKSLVLTGEYQLKREWSVTGGVRSRYTGASLEAGTHYAIIKSARQQMLLTVLGDLHYNLNPAYPGIRPQVGFGKRFTINSDVYIDSMVQAGTDLLIRNNDVGKTVLDPRYIGGLNITVAPAPILRAYLETSINMKPGGDERISSFAFDTFSFGIRFVKRKSTNKDLFEAGLGAEAPIISDYWGYHQGAVFGEGTLYLNKS